jgi:predicted PurR-regulated permease PerM
LTIASDHQRLRTVSLATLAAVAAIGALYLGREFFVPIAVALLFNALLRPLVRGLERMRVPAPAGAAIVVLGFVAVLVGGGFLLATPVQRWVVEVPRDFAAAREKLADFRHSISVLRRAADQVQQAAGPAPQAGAVAPAAPATPGIVSRVLGSTTSLVTGFVEVLLLVYLLLAVGTLFLQKLLRVVARDAKANLLDAVDEVKRVIERYVVVTVVINIAQGCIVALVMWGLGMPSPILWGIATLFLEAIPYLGATVMIGALALVAFATLQGVGHIVLVPATYLAITTLQNNVVSPIAYGRNLKLNPVAVLIAVMFWWFLWGIPGAFLAVPIVAAVRVIADHTDGLGALGEFLGA